MIGAMVGLVLIAVAAGIIWWAVNELLPLVPMHETFRTVVRVLLVVLVVLAAFLVLYVVTQLLVLVGVPVNTFGLLGHR